MPVQASGRVLHCSVRTSSFVLPLSHVLETMRPLPVRPIPGSPPFVRGLAIVRGEPVAVVDLSYMMEGHRGSPRHWIAVNAGKASVVLEVDRILGIRTLPPELLRDVPPLLQNADMEMVSAVGALDAGLLLVLDQGRLVSGELLERIGDALAEADA